MALILIFQYSEFLVILSSERIYYWFTHKHDKLKRQKPLQAAHQIDRLALQLLQAPASHSLQPAALLSQEYAHCVFVQPALNPHQNAQMRVQVTC